MKFVQWSASSPYEFFSVHGSDRLCIWNLKQNGLKPKSQTNVGNSNVVTAMVTWARLDAKQENSAAESYVVKIINLDVAVIDEL